MVLCVKKHQVTGCTCQMTKRQHNLILQRLGDKIWRFYLSSKIYVYLLSYFELGVELLEITIFFLFFLVSRLSRELM